VRRLPAATVPPSPPGSHEPSHVHCEEPMCNV